MKNWKKQQILRLEEALDSVEPGSKEYDAIQNELAEMQRISKTSKFKDVLDIACKWAGILAPPLIGAGTAYAIYKSEYKSENAIPKPALNVANKLGNFGSKT